MITNKDTFSFSIIIPALNEEKNIGNLLKDILLQIDFDNSLVEKVVVISDSSKDKTDEIVASISKINTVINFERNDTRLGKSFSLDKVFKKVNTDYVILLDADVRLEKNAIRTVIEEVIKSNAELIAGNPVPNTPSSLFNFAEQASLFSWYLVQAIKENSPKTIYSAHGRFLVLSKSLYKNLDLSKISTPGDDQFIYLSAKSFEYSKNSIVYYKLPSSFQDYLKQNVRFRYAKTFKTESFAQENTKDYFHVDNKSFILVKTILKHPYTFILWAILYTVGYLLFLKKIILRDCSIKEWGDAKSTK